MTMRLAQSGTIALLFLATVVVCHIAVGAKTIAVTTVGEAIFAYDETVFDHVVIRELRLPRAVLAIAVGAGLAVSGALMQGVTRNPIADPGLLGLLAGASFAVVLGTFTGLVGPIWMPALAALGALGAALIVWALAASVPGGATPLTIVMAGAVVTAFLAALTALMLLLDETSFDRLRVWLTGTLAQSPGETGPWASACLVVGLVLALATARHVTALAMGDEAATGLGVDVKKLRLAVLISVILLTASAVCLAGPLGFVGLVVPHIVRLIVGHDYRVIVPASAVAGATFLVLADIAARLLLAPAEISTGLVTALLGAPFFVWLVRMRL